MMVLESSTSKHSGNKSVASTQASNNLHQRRHRQEVANNQITSEGAPQFETLETVAEQAREITLVQPERKATKLTTYSEASADTMASCPATDKQAGHIPANACESLASANTINVSNGISGSSRFSDDTFSSST